MVQRLLLDGVHGHTGVAPVARQDQTPPERLADEAETALALLEAAAARAEVTYNSAVRSRVPPLGLGAAGWKRVRSGWNSRANHLSTCQFERPSPPHYQTVAAAYPTTESKSPVTSPEVR